MLYAFVLCANVRAVFGKGRNDWPFCFCYLVWSTTKHKLVGESKVNTRFKRCSSFFANKRRGPSSHSKSRWQLSSSRRWLPHRLCLFIWFCCYKIHDGFLNSRRLYRLPMQTTPKLWHLTAFLKSLRRAKIFANSSVVKSECETYNVPPLLQ